MKSPKQKKKREQSGVMMQRPVHVVPNPIFQITKLQRINPTIIKKRGRRPRKKR